jgi:DMSO/TMAO reductase YedYZ molybdopterin-dependent catalytic subunit
MDSAPGRRVVSREPFNAETPLEALSGVVPPSELHFVRSHFARPEHPGRLTIDGAVGRPLTVGLDDLVGRRSTSVVTTIECAGNGRAFLDPPVAGEPWRLGAVGTATWTGVRLGDLLDEAGLAPGVVEILFRGADRGAPTDVGREIAFERSLPVAAAAEAIVAHGMNNRPLPPEHGAPLRLVVPGWYGVASVKWLVAVTALTAPFRGFYQADRYVIGEEPLRLMAPRAVIVAPADGARVAAGVAGVAAGVAGVAAGAAGVAGVAAGVAADVAGVAGVAAGVAADVAGVVEIRGYAWSGGTTVDRVDVSVDAGSSWSPASLGPAIGHAWRTWRYAWHPSVLELAVLLARATDARGDVQPLDQVRNALGYRNNAAQPVTVEVVDA